MKFLIALLVSLSLLAPAYAAVEKKTAPTTAPTAAPTAAPKKAKPVKIHKKVEGTKVPVKK